MKAVQSENTVFLPVIHQVLINLLAFKKIYCYTGPVSYALGQPPPLSDPSVRL